MMMCVIERRYGKGRYETMKPKPKHYIIGLGAGSGLVGWWDCDTTTTHTRTISNTILLLITSYIILQYGMSFFVDKINVSYI